MNNLLRQALDFHQNKKWSDAKRIYEYILKVDPRNFDALLLLGLMYAEIDNPEKAIAHLLKAVKIDIKSEAASFNLAVAYMTKDQHENAERFFKQVLVINPLNLKAVIELAGLEMRKGAYQAGAQYYQRAIELDPNDSTVLKDFGDAQRRLGNLDEALQIINRSISLDANNPDALNVLGCIYVDAGKLENAKDAFEKVISVDPKMIGAHISLGNVFIKQGLYLEAMESYDKAIAIDPKSIVALTNKGQLLIRGAHYKEALELFNEAYRLDPSFKNLLGARIGVKLQLCEWKSLAEEIDELQLGVKNGCAATEPFIGLAISDSPLFQKKSAEVYFNKQFGLFKPQLQAREKASSRIVVAYLSADFRLHPISFLMAELFEVHNRDNFEFIGISFSAAKDEMQQRISAAFDQFIDANQKSDEEVIALMAQLGVDIAIDLGGYTQNSRFGIFAKRAAPIQMSYLGYLGTTGSNRIDYIIADNEIIPKESQKYYSEKVAYLPSYQANDSQRAISSREFTRKELGIREGAFIYCCFNNNYKILPDVFSSWMKILTRVENSVLFLYAENTYAQENLKKEALKRGVDPARLIFGGRLPVADYLARYRIADLFLDTFPYNAGTTASDALWVGVPVLTRQGDTFASRVASSLLKAIGLSELITKTVDEYESLACSLAENPEMLRDIKLKLEANKSTTPLFNTREVAANLESLFLKAHQRYITEQSIDHIHSD